jgi:hypothetical protein
VPLIEQIRSISYTTAVYPERGKFGIFCCKKMKITFFIKPQRRKKGEGK